MSRYLGWEQWGSGWYGSSGKAARYSHTARQTLKKQGEPMSALRAEQGPGRPSLAQRALGWMQGQCRVKVYLVCNSSRAFLPQPQRWGHVFQHLKHVIVTDAPTGNPFQRPGIVGWSTGEAHGRRGRAGSGQGRKQTRKQIQLTKVSGKRPKSKQVK